MAENKTRPTSASVDAFLAKVTDEKRREDCRQVIDLMREVTGQEPVLWGDSLIGFGAYAYKYASGRSGEFFLTGVSPRKQALTIYIMSGFRHHHELMESLGKFRTGKSCLYVKKLEDIDLGVLRRLIEASITRLRSAEA
jgi:hypothetical protein